MKKFSVGISSIVIVIAAEVASGAGDLLPVITGPIQSVDHSAGIVVVQGRRVESREAANVVVGQLVNVYGDVSDNGTVVRGVLESAASYGATMAIPAHSNSVGLGERGSIMGGTTERGSIMGGTTERGSIMGGTTERGSIMGGTTERGSIMGGTMENGE
jgi:hypothetical protein